MTPAKTDKVIDLTVYESFESLEAKLNMPPEKTKRNKYAGNSEYIPISFIEASLDDVYQGMWKTSNLHIKYIGSKEANKKTHLMFFCTITLEVLHPIMKVWISREGTASGETSQNQVQTFAGVLKADAMKNAAKSLGVKFGRDLNRNETANVASATDAKRQEFKEYLAKLDVAETKEEKIKIWRDSPYQNEPEYKKALQDAVRSEV